MQGLGTVITNPNEGCTEWAIDRASENGHLKVVQWLVAWQKSHLKITNFALVAACSNGHLEIVQFLIQLTMMQHQMTSFCLEEACVEKDILK